MWGFINLTQQVNYPNNFIITLPTETPQRINQFLAAVMHAAMCNEGHSIRGVAHQWIRVATVQLGLQAAAVQATWMIQSTWWKREPSWRMWLETNLHTEYGWTGCFPRATCRIYHRLRFMVECVGGPAESDLGFVWGPPSWLLVLSSHVSFTADDAIFTIFKRAYASNILPSYYNSHPQHPHPYINLADSYYPMQWFSWRCRKFLDAMWHFVLWNFWIPYF